jgi:DNA-binding NarL/FixJ family response regulator
VLDLAAATRPDVVVLDMDLPVMDGLETLPLLRLRTPTAVVILVCEDHQAPDIHSDAARLGASAGLTKRLVSRDLISVWRGAVPGKAPEQRTRKSSHPGGDPRCSSRHGTPTT